MPFNRNLFYKWSWRLAIPIFGPLIGSYFIVSSTRSKRIDRDFTGFNPVNVKHPYLTSHQAKSCLLPAELAEGAENARLGLEDKLSPSDIVIASFPRSGTTWLSEIVYQLTEGVKCAPNNEATNIEERVPYLEYPWPGPSAILTKKSPRIIKTHLPIYHLPMQIQRGEAARIIYIVRDPRDVVISYYHFTRCFVPAGYSGREGIGIFAKRFLDDRLPYSPWTDHVTGYLQAAVATSINPQSTIRPKILIVSYSQLKSQLRHVIQRIESFLSETSSDGEGKSRLSDEQLDRLVEHCSFESMRSNQSTNFSWWKQLGLWSCDTGFIRSGRTGSYIDSLSPLLVKQIAEKAKERELEWVLDRD